MENRKVSKYLVLLHNDGTERDVINVGFVVNLIGMPDWPSTWHKEIRT